MRESSDRIQNALRGTNAHEQLIAHRIMENPTAWQLWESEHSSLMRQVAAYGVLRTQAAALKQTALRLIHDKALFEYLRKTRVGGAERAKILAHFHPTHNYTYAIIAEHGRYLRKACSYLCTSHVGSDLVQDEAFLDPMQQYETLYAEYFDLYCSTLFATDEVESASELVLLPLLKHQLNEWRWVILNPRQALPRLRHESEIRRPTGDTQRLPILGNGFKHRA
jgi:hypothetical protein